MLALKLLRRLAEQGSFSALLDAGPELDPEDPAIQILLAQAAARLGDRESAEHTLTRLAGRPLDVDARVDLAAVHIALGDIESAVDILEAARPDSPDHPLLLARLGWCRLQQARAEEAIDLYARSLARQPRIGVFLGLLGLYRDYGPLAGMATCLDTARAFWRTERGLWPDPIRRSHDRQLDSLQLDLLLARDGFESAEGWVEQSYAHLDEDNWCALVSELARRLAAGDRHAAAEEWLRTGLRRYPERPALYAQAAELAVLQGRALQAVALMRRAIRHAAAGNEPTSPLWARLSAFALQIDTTLAREAAERAEAALAQRAAGTKADAEAQRDSQLAVQVAFADVDVRDRRYPEAEQRYRHVLERRPRMIPALQGLGQLLMELGRIDEATEQFERVKALDPARGHGALINARRFPEDPETLRRIETLARTPGPEGSVNTSLLFQLAAAWEKREDYARAFALADEANAASRRLIGYDPAAHRQHCARLRHAFPPALFEQRAHSGLDSTLPVFIVGMPRSGTTLAEQILAGHSRIHGAGELGTIPRVIAGLERWERYTGSGRHYPDCVDDLDPRVLRGIAEDVLQELEGYGPGARHVVDKLPHNFENIGLIKLLFPRARIISLRRDPRDVAISNYFIDFAARHGGMGFAYDLDWIGEQLADHNLLMHHWHQVFPGEILEVQYEQLVDDPATVSRRMLDYIGVNWEPTVLDFAERRRPVRTASVWQVRQPIHAGSVARWRRYRTHLPRLIAATNRPIAWDPVEMVTLPEPGWLNRGVDLYRQGELDDAEYQFKQLLHHLPEHAAARFMLGLIYVDKGHRVDGIRHLERAVQACPWNHRWRQDLARAYRLEGRHRDAQTLLEPVPAGEDPANTPRPEDNIPASHLDHLFLSEQATCPHPANSGARS